jgi:hypothetical protein
MDLRAPVLELAWQTTLSLLLPCQRLRSGILVAVVAHFCPLSSFLAPPAWSRLKGRKACTDTGSVREPR